MKIIRDINKLYGKSRKELSDISLALTNDTIIVFTLAIFLTIMIVIFGETFSEKIYGLLFMLIFGGGAFALRYKPFNPINLTKTIILTIIYGSIVVGIWALIIRGFMIGQKFWFGWQSIIGIFIVFLISFGGINEVKEKWEEYLNGK